MKDEVLNFISLFKKDEKFLDGLCYWFTCILNGRFPNGVTYYDPISCHFYYVIEDIAYDVTGEVKLPEKAVIWDTYKFLDDTHYQRIVKQCILKVGD